MTDQDIYTSIGSRIRQEREARGMTLDQLANELGIGSSHLSRMERGERGVDTVLLRRLGRMFDLPMDAFFEMPEATDALAFARQGDAHDDAMSEMVEWGLRLHANMAFVEREYEQISG